MSATIKKIDRLVDEYLQTWKQEHLTERIRKLINFASYDLYYGPSVERDENFPYPGFSKACKEIAQALDDADLSELYVDTMVEEVYDTEPQVDEFGMELIYKIERHEVIEALVGKELGKYIR